MSKNLPLAKKALGQHWLEDESSLKAMVEAAHIKPGSVVLEIGPGTGTLTDQLIVAGAEVVALEYDPERFVALQKKYQNYKSTDIAIQQGDIRSFNFADLPADYKIVANIPYYLTANLLRKLTDDTHKPGVAVLLVQKEVAERVAARPGRLSQLAVFTQIFYDVQVGAIVPARLFTPPPKVDSQILILYKRNQPAITPSKELFAIVKAGFAEKRKKLRTSLSRGLGLSTQQVEHALQSVGLPANARAQELSLEQWAELAHHLPFPA